MSALGTTVTVTVTVTVGAVTVTVTVTVPPNAHMPLWTRCLGEKSHVLHVDFLQSRNSVSSKMFRILDEMTVNTG